MSEAEGESDEQEFIWPPTPLMRFFVSEARGELGALNNDSPRWKTYEDKLRSISKAKEDSRRSGRRRYK